MRREKVVIELDGGQHNQEINIVEDLQRTDFIKSKGYRVIRFWNNEVNDNIEGVYKYLLENL